MYESPELNSRSILKTVETAVVIVAGGRGQRASGAGMPKQYRPLAGTPILTRALESFVSHGDVDAILTVIHGDDRSHFEIAAAPFTDSSRPALPVA